MRLDKPAGTITRLSLPWESILCGDKTVCCGSEYYTCGGTRLPWNRISSVIGLSSRGIKPTNGISRVSRPTGTITRLSEVT